MLSTPPLYLPQIPLPAYAYRPGRDPHPIRDPRGHLFGDETHWGPAPDPAAWSDSAGYLRGADLHNTAYFWEAHEVWEELWHEPFDSQQAEFLQALIQMTAAALQVQLGHAAGARRLAGRAAGRLTEVASQAGTWYMGVELAPLIVLLRELQEAEEPQIEAATFPLILQPAPGNAVGPSE